MKTKFYLGLILTIALVAVGAAACAQQTATNGNTATTNRNSAMNQNSSMNMNGMNHNSMPMNSANHDMSQMHHGGMSSDPNAASAPYDLQFIDTMTHHHEGAIEMAEMALKKSENDGLKKFAQKIIDDQRKEIAQMKQWRDKWYAGRPRAQNMEMPGMSDSMKMMMSGDMKRMETAKGKDFDVLFLDMMTPHHRGAVVMAQEALQKAEHAELKTLARTIIREQEEEIKQMADWKAKWAK
jgi:uncharacterized protein (DUF305 family)